MQNQNSIITIKPYLILLIILSTILQVSSYQVKEIKLIKHTPSNITYISDSNNVSLYVFSKDSHDYSSCTSGCSFTWEPVTNSSLIEIDKSITGKVSFLKTKLTNSHLTINGRPLYVKKDQVYPNKINSHGVLSYEGYWYLVLYDGNVLINYGNVYQNDSMAVITLNGMTDNYYGSSWIGDSNGTALYINSKDRFGQSSCEGECLDEWSYYKANDGAYFYNGDNLSNDQMNRLYISNSLNVSLFGVIKLQSKGGAVYVYAYNGFPLYYYKNSKGTKTLLPELQAQDLNERKWYLLTKDGNVIFQSKATGEKNELVAWSKEMYNEFGLGEYLRISLMVLIGLVVVVL